MLGRLLFYSPKYRKRFEHSGLGVLLNAMPVGCRIDAVMVNTWVRQADAARLFGISGQQVHAAVKRGSVRYTFAHGLNTVWLADVVKWRKHVEARKSRRNQNRAIDAPISTDRNDGS